MTAFEGNTVVMQYWASYGWDLSDQGFYATASGTYYIFAKNADLTWTEWDRRTSSTGWPTTITAQTGSTPGVSDANGNVIPGGAGKTGGCVALEPSEAKALEWAPIGTRVEIHW